MSIQNRLEKILIEDKINKFFIEDYIKNNKDLVELCKFLIKVNADTSIKEACDKIIKNKPYSNIKDLKYDIKIIRDFTKAYLEDVTK